MATRATFVIRYGSGGTVGATLTFPFRDGDNTITLKVVAAGTTPQAMAGEFNSQESMEAAIVARLSSHYTITRVTNTITITGNNYGTAYDIGTPTENGYTATQIVSRTGGTGSAFGFSTSKTNVTVKNAADGTITVTPSGGNTPYTYAWADGATTATRTGLGPGSYSVTVSESGGLSQSTTVTITEPNFPPVTVSGTVTNVICFGSATGAISISRSGGDGVNYTYLWNDGVTTQNRTGLTAGNYSVTVGSAGFTANANFVVSQNSEIVVVATVDEDDVTLAVSGGIGPYTYLWSDGVTSQDRADMQPGSYNVTIIDTQGCGKNVSVNIRKFEFFFSRNPITLPLQALDPGAKPNLSFLCELWVEEVYLSGNYSRVSESEQPADSLGATVFDVQAIMDAYLSPYLPEGKETQVSQANTLFKRFYLRYTEKFGNPPLPAPYTQVDVNYSVLGGLSFEEYAARTYFTTYLATQKPFFTWDPLDKQVFSDQPEYLYFMPNSFTLTAFRCQVKIYYTDGTSATHQFHQQNNIQRFELYCIPAGYLQLNLASYQPAKTVSGWEIWIQDPANAEISDRRTYTLRTDYVQNRRYFLYLNSVGGLNTLCCTGKAKMEIDPDAVQIEKILPYNYRISDGETTTISRMANRTLQLSTGYLASEYKAALQDFIISEYVVMVDNGRYVPGSVKPKNTNAFDENETLAFLDFEFVLPKMYRYTPRL